MDRVKDILWTGFKNTGIAMTFGAYHLYLMDEKWKLQQTMYRLQDEKAKAMLKEMKRHNRSD